MEQKNFTSGALRAYFAVFPAILVGVLVLAAVLLRFLLGEDAGAWLDVIAWAAVGLSAANPGVFLLLLPLRGALSKTEGGCFVKEAVTVNGVGRETLDRSAAIAHAKAGGPVAAGLRAFCGDIAVPPDKFIEMAGLGASAQFSGQMIHAGNAEYMKGLKVEAPDVPGEVVFVALEGRLLGYYRLLPPQDTKSVTMRVNTAVLACAALKMGAWALLALTGTDMLPGFVGIETVSLLIGLAAIGRLAK